MNSDEEFYSPTIYHPCLPPEPPEPLCLLASSLMHELTAELPEALPRVHLSPPPSTLKCNFLQISDLNVYVYECGHSQGSLTRSGFLQESLDHTHTVISIFKPDLPASGAPLKRLLEMMTGQTSFLSLSLAD